MASVTLDSRLNVSNHAQQLLRARQSLTHCFRALPGQRDAGPKRLNSLNHAPPLLSAR